MQEVHLCAKPQIKLNRDRSNKNYFRLCSLISFAACLVVSTHAQRQKMHPVAKIPDFGSNVHILFPSMSSAEIQATLNQLNHEAEFSVRRSAVLLMPGNYSGINSNISYYQSVAGLGKRPEDVVVHGDFSSDLANSEQNDLVNFWRSMENLDLVNPSTLYWGVSQGSSLRHLIIRGELQLTDAKCGPSSGGFLADSVIKGAVFSCSQQQWYTRDSSIKGWRGGLWNIVFSGVKGAPKADFLKNSYTVLSLTPVKREKPYLFVDRQGCFRVFIPDVERDSRGATWYQETQVGRSRPIEDFLIASPTTPVEEINKALAHGKNLLLTPGIYRYSTAIRVTQPDTVVLGLGFATLVPQRGNIAIEVADVDGVQISSLVVDAGRVNSECLLQIGRPGSSGKEHRQDPTALHDVYFRVGGASIGTATTSLEVDSNDVILDNVWAWRADHAMTAVGWEINKGKNGVVVNGDRVTALGLAVEHYQNYQVFWSGNDGRTIFYQSELPYDVPDQAAWMNGSERGIPSYFVSPRVTTHSAYGLGIYSFFNQGVDIVEDTAISVPKTGSVIIHNAVTIFLAGSGRIGSVVNGSGAVAKEGTTKIVVLLYPTPDDEVFQK